MDGHSRFSIGTADSEDSTIATKSRKLKKIPSLHGDARMWQSENASFSQKAPEKPASPRNLHTSFSHHGNTRNSFRTSYQSNANNSPANPRITILPPRFQKMCTLHENKDPKGKEST